MKGDSFDFPGITHVKVGIIALRKISLGAPDGRDQCVRVYVLVFICVLKRLLIKNGLYAALILIYFERRTYEINSF